MEGMMLLNLLSLLGFRLRTSVRAPDRPPQTSEKSEVFLLSEDIIKAGNYTLPASINLNLPSLSISSQFLYRTQTLHQTGSKWILRCKTP